MSWDIMGYHGISWEIMGYHGRSWDIMGYHGISCDFWVLSSPFVIFQLFAEFFAFPFFFGAVQPKLFEVFVMSVFVFPFFLWAVQPRLYRFWCLLVCVLQIFFRLSSPQFPKKSWREYPAYRSWRGCSPKIPGRNIQPTDPQKSWREYPAYRSWRDCSPKNPGQNIQPTDPGGTVPQKILEGIPSLQILKKLEGMFPKKSWTNYPVHSSQKTAGTIQSTLPQKNPGTLQRLSSPHFPKKPCRDYPVHTSQKNPGGTIQSTVPKKTLQGLSSPHFPKKNLQGLSSPHFPKKTCRDYPVHSSQKNLGGTIQSTVSKKKILMLFHHLQA